MKTSKKILGATLALSLIIPLSGCGGSKYAIKGCKPTENFPCVPADENNTNNSIVVTDSWNTIKLGRDVTTGSKIIISPKTPDKINALDAMRFAINSADNSSHSKKIDVIINGETISGTGQLAEFELSKDSQTVIELPEEAIGKYVSFDILIHSDSYRAGEIKVTVE